MSETLIEAPVSQYDPFDPEVLAAVHHHDGLLREVAPVVYIEKYDFYAITRAKKFRRPCEIFGSSPLLTVPSTSPTRSAPMPP